VLLDAVITQITDPFMGRELSAADLEDLRDRLTRAYVSRSYINSGAVLPNQRFENRVLTYRVVEGRLAEIDVTGTVWLSPRYVRDRMARAIGFPLNINDVERGVQLLLNDPAIAQMNGELVPGLEPGEARLHVNVTEAKRYSLAATIANSAPPNVGSVLGELGGVFTPAVALKCLVTRPGGCDRCSTTPAYRLWLPALVQGLR
jgi:hemolysin activation/secretion protein